MRWNKSNGGEGMRTKEKQELVRLLHAYMEDIVAENERNTKGCYKSGLKAQYEHARIIATKMSVDIGKEIKTYWQL